MQSASIIHLHMHFSFLRAPCHRTVTPQAAGGNSKTSPDTEGQGGLSGRGSEED